MKLTGILLLAGFFTLSAKTASQNATVTINLENEALAKVFDAIEAQTDYVLFYKKDVVDDAQKVTVKVKNESVRQVLNQVLNTSKVSYSMVDNSIVIGPANAAQTMQVKHVTGKVTDTKGEPLPGVSVLIKGTTTGTITDVEGKYSVEVGGSDAVLIFSFIGFKNQEVLVAQQTQINVVLEDETFGMEEVVIVGFAVQNKVNLTGSVGVAKAEDLEARPVANAVQALQGLVAGLNITTSGNAGELNSKKSINIRGTATIGEGSKGDPLVLIDGMEGDINSINPQDIESISVLKDAASSSIYGSRAPFGVILITTKSGKEGKTTINYNNSFRYNTPVMLPRMQNSWEFVNFFDDANFNSSNTHLYNDSFKQRVKDYYDGVLEPNDVALAASSGKWDYDYTNANVNWLKEYYKKWSPSQEHNISISGGAPKLTYYISSNILTQDGFMRYGTEGFDRYTTTGKFSGQLTNNIKVDYSTRFVRTEYARPTAMNDDFYNHILRRARPIRAIKDPNGYYMADINYALTMKEGGRHKEQNDVLAQQGKITITPAKDWNIIGEFNLKTDNNWTHWDQKRVYSHYANNPENTYLALTSPANDVVYEYSFRSTFVNPNLYTNYTKKIDKHTFTVLAGMQSEQYKQRLLSAQRNDMISTNFPVLDLTTNNTSTSIKGNYDDWATLGYFGRLNYDYEGKYLLELNTRYDGTSRYREDMRWIWTPSASIGWNIAKEPFFQNLTPYVSSLKLRASYGVLGNQNTSKFYPTYLTIGNGTASGNWLVNGTKPNTATAPAEIISSLLTWEKVKTTNLGIDFRSFSDRLTGSFDYYIRNTIDMVGAGVELPVTLGLGSPAFNNTDLRTSGWELDLGWRDQKGGVSYGVRVNVSDARTKITRYGNPTGTLDKYVVDQFTGNIYGYTTIGIAKTNEEMNEHLATLPNGGQNALGSNWAAGDIMFKDLNNDGKINNGSNTIHDMGDLKKIGNNTPRFRTGINIDVAYKGFDMQMFWQGVLKRDYYPTGMVFWGTTGSGQWWSTAFKEHLDYFRADANHPLGQNLDSYYPRPLFSGKNQVTQTKYLQDASYMRLKNLQLGYTFKQPWLSVVKLQSVRAFVSGENLLTFTKLSKTMDPETAGIGAQGGTVYPLSKTYSFGISANF